jgi:hypothetical protein
MIKIGDKVQYTRKMVKNAFSYDKAYADMQGIVVHAEKIGHNQYLKINWGDSVGIKGCLASNIEKI